MKTQILVLICATQMVFANPSLEPFENPYSEGDTGPQVSQNSDQPTEFGVDEEGLTEMPEMESDGGFQALTSEEVAQLEGIYSQSVKTKRAGIDKQSKKSGKKSKSKKKNKSRNRG